MVKFIRIVPGTRKVEFDVNGTVITRGFPLQFVGTTDDMITALARGLAIEDSKNAARDVEGEVTLTSGAVIVPDPTPIAS